MNRFRQFIKKIPFLKMGYYFLFKSKKNPYRLIRKSLEKIDKQNTHSNPKLLELHNELNRLKKAQISKWNSFVYCDGYFYQGYNRIGISGIKPTEKRIKNYDIHSYLSKNKTVLDIGSNAGFLSCYLAEFSKEVDGIELNPYLIEMSETTKRFLHINNVHFIEGNFITYILEKTYDIVFSLSNHFTIDGNLNIGFETYILKVYHLTNKNGILFFESHDINGDDKDLDIKFQIASKYFKLIKYKMVKAFYPSDIDKLFAIFVRLDKPSATIKTDFKLVEARNLYQY